MNRPKRSRVAQYADALATVAYLSGSDDVAFQWMTTPRECLAGRTAAQAIKDGDGALVAKLVDEEFDACQN